MKPVRPAKPADAGADADRTAKGDDAQGVDRIEAAGFVVYSRLLALRAEADALRGRLLSDRRELQKNRRSQTIASRQLGDFADLFDRLAAVEVDLPQWGLDVAPEEGSATPKGNGNTLRVRSYLASLPHGAEFTLRSVMAATGAPKGTVGHVIWALCAKGDAKRGGAGAGAGARGGADGRRPSKIRDLNSKTMLTIRSLKKGRYMRTGNVGKR